MGEQLGSRARRAAVASTSRRCETVIAALQAGVHSTQGLASRTGRSQTVHLVDVDDSAAVMELSLLDEQVAMASPSLPFK